MPQVKRSIVITASEVGDFVYCAKAWHLKRCGELARGESLGEGVSFHEKHAASVLRAERLSRAGKLFAVIALILLVALILFWSAGGAR